MSNINEIILYEFSLIGAGLGGAARLAGDRALHWGLTNAAEHAAMHGTIGTTQGIASLIPGVDSIVGGGLAAYQQHAINHMQDEYDKLRGIEPTSSSLGNGLSVAASTLLGAIPGFGWVTNIVQGSRMKAWQDKLNALKDKIGFRNLQMGTPPVSQNGEA